MKKLFWAVALLTILHFASFARCDVFISQVGGLGVTYDVSSGSQGLIIIIYSTGNPAISVFVEATTPNTAIESIIVAPQTNSPYTPDSLNTTLIVRGRAGTSGYVGYLGSITRSGTNGDLVIGSVIVAGNIGNPASPSSNFISGSAINTIRADGDIAARITAYGSTQFNGNITNIESTGGRILGDITAAATIATQIKAASTIGSTTRTVSIGVGGDLQKIEGTEIYANITNGSGGALGQLKQLKTSSGVFKGSLKATSIQGSAAGTIGLDVATTLDADVTVTNDIKRPVVVGGALASTRTIKVGGGLVTSGSDTGRLQFAANGLSGQVILNSSAGSNAWTGEVKVGSTVLSTPPYYTQRSSDLGGGAVGLATFHLYDTDCKPANMRLTSVDLPGSNRETIVTPDFMAGGTNDAIPVRIRFYGPITFTSVVIECAPLSFASDPCALVTNGSSWSAVNGSFLVRAPGTTVGSTTLSAREFGLSRNSVNTYVAPGLYRVRFTNVRSALGLSPSTANPLVAATQLCGDDELSAAYYFRVGADCDGDGWDDQFDTDVPQTCATGCTDFNHHDGVTVQDIFDFLQAWFGYCYIPHGGTLDPSCVGNADWNHNETLEVQDIFDFLTSWFGPNGGC